MAKPYRGRGMMARLLKAAVEYAKEQGAQIVEGYPVYYPEHTLNGYIGVVSTFRRAGFVEVLRRAKHRPIMRYYIEGKIR